MRSKTKHKEILNAVKEMNELYDSVENLYKLQERAHRREFIEFMAEMVVNNESPESILEEYIEFLNTFELPIPNCLLSTDQKEMIGNIDFILGIYGRNYKRDYIDKAEA